MRRFSLIIATLVLAGCGESARGLIPERSADRLIEQVDAAEAAVASNKCVDARQAAEAGARRVDAMQRLDPDLKANLLDWFEHLEDEARKECNRRNEPAESTPTASPTATEEPEETPSPTPTATEEPDETPTPTATAEPTVEPTAAPGVDGDG